MNSSSDEKALIDEARGYVHPDSAHALYLIGALADALESTSAVLVRKDQAINEIRALHKVIAYDEAGNHFCEHSRLDDPCETARILSDLSEHQEAK